MFIRWREKDITLKKTEVGDRVRLNRVFEEHSTLIKEPKSQFIGYAVQKAIVNFLISKNYWLENLVAINCDGAPVNTCYKTGVNMSMERFLQTSLQWNVCLLQWTSSKSVGKQIGPGIWSGLLCSELLSCESQPVRSDVTIIKFSKVVFSIHTFDKLIIIKIPLRLFVDLMTGTFAMISATYFAWL